ncbi:hypothetical protein BN970_00311 [Mycolicibacterium conceptionense]|uniref:Uncharacterized protein n=1 Tax=Mycolicibacterium conceptionense TaxID=451644 RepID=A0A0U1CVW3_9MYCO|nr:hypothetical protein BN970_00311 [Mycolicibacterium conceptionense]
MRAVFQGVLVLVVLVTAFFSGGTDSVDTAAVSFR